MQALIRAGRGSGRSLTPTGLAVEHAIYDRISVAGPEIVGVRLTQAAYAHGLGAGATRKG